MTVAYAPDALHTLRDSFALHLDASRCKSTQRIYLAALDRLIGHLEAHGMPTRARAVRREHVESFVASRRDTVKPTTLSVEFRALQRFRRWCVEEDEIDRSPMERMKAPKVPESPVPVVSLDDFRKLLKTAEGRDYIDRRDMAILRLMFDTGIRRGELEGLRVDDVELRERLAYITGKGGHTRAVRFGSKTVVAIDRYPATAPRASHGRLPCRLARPGRATDRLGFRADHHQGLRGGRPAATPSAPVPTHARPRVPRRWWPGRHLQRLAGWRSPQMLRRYEASMADERARAEYKSPVDRL